MSSHAQTHSGSEKQMDRNWTDRKTDRQTDRQLTEDKMKVSSNSMYKLFPIPSIFNYFASTVIIIAMVIGFTQRSQTVSEGIPLIGENSRIIADVASIRTSEREYILTIQHLEHRSLALVSSFSQPVVDSDALFGFPQDPSDPLQHTFLLTPGRSELRPSATIIYDLAVELEECFTLEIRFFTFPGTREPLVTCNDSISASNFFCEHTICIEDDDGMFSLMWDTM